MSRALICKHKITIEICRANYKHISYVIQKKFLTMQQTEIKDVQDTILKPRYQYVPELCSLEHCVKVAVGVMVVTF